MKQITLTILAEDILLNNYIDSNNCPITKALLKAGYINLKDTGFISGYDKDNEYICLRDNINDEDGFNESYAELLNKLFAMYNSMGHSYNFNNIIPKPILVETFTHTLEY